MTSYKKVSGLLLAGICILVLIACNKNEGPAEHAGKELDKATAKVGEKIEKAGESVQDAAQGK